MRIRAKSGERVAVAEAAPLTASNDGAVVPIGTLLTLPESEIELVLDHQSRSGQLFGEIAVSLGLVGADDVSRAIQQQHNFTLLAPGDERVHSLVEAAFNPGSEMARSARALRTAMLAPGAPSSSVVGVLSVGAGTEASLIAANLAIVCAQAGRNTLMVDANLEHPTQHGLFKVPNRAGLSTWLGLEQDLTGLIRHSAFPLLSVLAAGPIILNGGELFERSRLDERLHMLSDRFAQIIVDAGRVGSNAAAVASGLGGAFIVARRDVSSSRELKSLVESLNNAGTSVLGTVLAD